MESFQITKTLSKVVTQMELEETDDIRTMIKDSLRQDLEGIFIKEGYVIPDTLRVVDMSAGHVISESLSGDLHYNVMIEAKVHRAKPGDILKGVIKDKNKFGIHLIVEPLDIILGYVHHKNQDGLKEMEIGDEIEIVIATSRFQIGDKRQRVVAIWKEDDNAKHY